MAVTPDQAIELARALWLREAPPVAVEPATIWSVRRLDRPGTSYYLVILRTVAGAAHVATVDRASGRIGSSATLANGRSPITISPEHARELAGAGESGAAELVWMPSQASRSPLYPIWRVGAHDAWRYVSQQGQVFDRLTGAGPGGAG